MPPPSLSRRPAAYRIGVGVWGRSLQGAVTLAAVLAICAANCRGQARPLPPTGDAGGVTARGPGLGRRAPAGRKGPTLARGDPPDLRRRGEWLADREK